jgi:hypothetical protein
MLREVIICLSHTAGEFARSGSHRVPSANFLGKSWGAEALDLRAGQHAPWCDQDADWAVLAVSRFQGSQGAGDPQEAQQSASLAVSPTG